MKKTGCCEYLIAGGDQALFTSQEAPEDRPDVGIQALVDVSHLNVLCNQCVYVQKMISGSPLIILNKVITQKPFRL